MKSVRRSSLIYVVPPLIALFLYVLTHDVNYMIALPIILGLEYTALKVQVRRVKVACFLISLVLPFTLYTIQNSMELINTILMALELMFVIVIISSEFKKMTKMEKVGIFIVLFMVSIAIFAPLIARYSPTDPVDMPLLPPSWKHPFGTDDLGMDMWSRTVYGARTVLIVVFISTLFSMSIGVLLGLLSGYYGGKLDRALSMIMDSLYAFPSLILAIALAVALGPSLINAAIAIAVVYIPTYFRMVRGQVLKVKSEQFVEQLRVMGLKDRTILFKHILKHVIPTIMVIFSLNAADAVLTEAALSYLGLSVQYPTPDWGLDLYRGQAYILAGYWWLVFFPGLFITLLAFGFALIGEGLGERVGRA